MLHLDKTDHGTLLTAVSNGLQAASSGLSAMTSHPICLSNPQVTFVPLPAIPGIAGGPEAVVVAVYLGVEGDVCGHLMLLLTAESACRLADLLLERPVGTARDLGEMDLSALAEAGNIGGSFFLNTLADASGLVIVPSSPSLVQDMAGAILQAVVAPLYLEGEEALVVETEIDGSIRGHLLLLADHGSLQRLLDSLRDRP